MDYSGDTVLPAEDTLLALIDHLVLPLLPLNPSQCEIPSLEEQKEVSVQLHAVVLLYNYYIKKRHPDLVFLTFDLFCQMAVIVKPSLAIHLTLSSQPNQEEGKLSVTERAVMEACNICKGLDPCKSEPDITKWPLSKVAVLLVDSTKEKCMLKFSNVTKGVWSLIEKNLDAPTHSKEVSVNALLWKVAFSAVKEQAGFDETDLTILWNHRTYSLSREKSTTQFCIMQYAKPMIDHFIDIEYLISCLEGPLVTREENLFEVTSVVDNFHLLPYRSALSNWFERRHDPVDPELLHDKELETSCDDYSLGNEIQQANSKQEISNSIKTEPSICKRKIDRVSDLQKLDMSTPANKKHFGLDGASSGCSKDLLLVVKEMKGMLSSPTLADEDQVGDCQITEYTPRNVLAGINGLEQPNIPAFKHPHAQLLPNLAQNSSDNRSPKNQHFERCRELLDEQSNAMLKTALGALQEKLDTLHQEQRCVEEMVGEVEKYIGTNPSGSNDALLKVKLIYEAFRAAYGKGLSGSCTDIDEICQSQGMTKKEAT